MAEEENFFADSQTYELGMGRLSRVAGEAFLDWLSLPSGLRCLDVGCGTGSFTKLLLDRTAPSAVSAIDPSEGQVAFAKRKSWASRVDLRVGDAMALPFDDDQFDAAVMALVVQYIPDPTKAMSDITRVVRQRGRSIEIQIDFESFDDYWSSLSGETIRNMTDEDVEQLKFALSERLPADENGRISYMARANAIRGQVPET